MHPQATRRAELVFTLFDADGNGVIEAEDFDLMTDRVIAAAQGSDSAQGPDSVQGPDAAALSAIRYAFARYWTTLAAELDADGDGRITREEFAPFVLSAERFGPTVEEFARALANLGDPDGDGLIERPLFVALMLAIGFQLENIHALFDAFAPDGEDRITVGTWVAGIKDFYAPDLVDIAGDRLVSGPLAGTAAD